jgi:hypothetical protein
MPALYWSGSQRAWFAAPAELKRAKRKNHDDASTSLTFGQSRDGLALVEACVARGVPLLGVCRGFQEMNVVFGAALSGAMPEPDTNSALTARGFCPARRNAWWEGETVKRRNDPNIMRST